MKKFLIEFMLSVSLVFSACAKQDDREVAETAYTTLQVASILYDTAMKVAVDARSSGKLSNEQWLRIVKAGNVYYDSYQAAASALGVYMELIDDVEGDKFDRDELKILLTSCSSSLRVFISELKDLGVSIKEISDGSRN